MLDIVTALAGRYDAVYAELETYKDKVNYDNAMIENYNAAIAAANKASSNGTSSGNPNDATFTYTDPTTGAQEQMSVADFMKQNGDSPATGTSSWSSSDWSTAITTMTNDSDACSSDSQLDSSYLQEYMSEAESTITEMSQVISDWGSNIKSVYQNIR